MKENTKNIVNRACRTQEENKKKLTTKKRSKEIYIQSKN